MRRPLLPLLFSLALVSCASTAPAARGSGRLAHNVVLWLAPEVDAGALADELLAMTRDFPGLETVTVGTPRPTDRPVVDASFGLMLTMVFEDEAAERAWQEHPPHRRLVEGFGTRVERLVVYDALE